MIFLHIFTKTSNGSRFISVHCKTLEKGVYFFPELRFLRTIYLHCSASTWRYNGQINDRLTTRGLHPLFTGFPLLSSLSSPLSFLFLLTPSFLSVTSEVIAVVNCGSTVYKKSFSLILLTIITTKVKENLLILILFYCKELVCNG